MEVIDGAPIEPNEIKLDPVAVEKIDNISDAGGAVFGAGFILHALEFLDPEMAGAVRGIHENLPILLETAGFVVVVLARGPIVIRKAIRFIKRK